MFGHKKHIYTCPDVIHNMQKAKRRNRTILAMEAGMLVAGAAWIWLIEKKESKAASSLTENTTVDYPQFDENK